MISDPLLQEAARIHVPGWHALAPMQSRSSHQPGRDSLAQVTRYPYVKEFPLGRPLNGPRERGDTAVVVIELDCCPFESDFATTRASGIIRVQQEIVG